MARTRSQWASPGGTEGQSGEKGRRHDTDRNRAVAQDPGEKI